MEDQRFIAFLLSLAVLATAVINSGSVTAHSTSGVETTGVEGKNANAYDEGARDDLWPENSTQPNSDEVSLKESGDSIDDVPTGLNEGNSVNVTVEEPDINGTTTEATMDLDQLEQEIHDLNMKVLQSVGIFVGAIAGTAISVSIARKCYKMYTAMYRGRVPPTPIDPAIATVRFSDLYEVSHM